MRVAIDLDGVLADLDAAFAADLVATYPEHADVLPELTRDRTELLRASSWLQQP